MLRGIKNSDIENCYKLYCENHKFYDEFIEREILSRDFVTLSQFTSLIKDGCVRGVLIEHSSKSTSNIEYKELDVILIFSIKEISFDVILVELRKPNVPAFKDLLYYVVDKANSTKNSIINCTLPESQLNYCKGACELGFSCKMEHNSNEVKLFKKGKL